MSGSSRPGRVSLLVRNLPLDARPDDIRMKFERYGEIRDVYLPRDFYTGRLRGFGFIEFRDTRDAEDAMYEMDRRQLGGREISVVLSKENRKTPREMLRRDDSEPRTERRRRSRSRSPRRSRRRSHSRSPRAGSRRRSDSPAGRSRSRSPRNQRSQSPADVRERERSASRSASPGPARAHSPRPGSMLPDGEETFPARHVNGDSIRGPSAASLPGEDCEPAA